MASEKEIDKFIASQKTFACTKPEYIKTKKALREVLLAMPDKDYKKATKNLILCVLHKKSLGQLMHVGPVKGKLKILQLTVPKNIPYESLRHVIAHEFGHAMQGRSWRKSDGLKLEKDADAWARKWGFPRTKWMDE